MGENDGVKRREKPQRRKTNELSIRKYMQKSESVQHLVRFDTFTSKMVLQHPVPRPGLEASTNFRPRPWQDTDTTALIEWLIAEHFDKVRRGMVDAAIALQAATQSYSTAVERFDALPPWDSKERLDTFLIDVCGIVEQDEKRLAYLRAVSRCFFISICARVYRPGCKVDTMLVLEGPQGINKSRLLRLLALVDDSFSDSLPHNLSSKDAKQHLSGKLIVELSEIAQMDKSTNEALKAFLSAQDDKFRPSYGRHEIVSLRQCVFVGTTNDSEYLRDISGNRRYWPITCGAIDLDHARDNIEQVYAEAKHALLDRGEPWWFENGENEQAEIEQAARYQEDIWTDRIASFIADSWAMTPEGEECLVSIDQCLDHLDIPIKDRAKSHQMRIGSILKTKGGQRVRKKYKNNRRFWTYLFSGVSQL